MKQKLKRFMAGFMAMLKVLNRRSDRKSYTREGFIEMLKYYPLAMPKIYVSLF